MARDFETRRNCSVGRKRRHSAGEIWAAWISGSTAMFTEAIYSLVDTGDQVLLLVGQRGAKAADPTHPLGYGMEVYFWSFVVALMVFLLGGVLSVYEGVRQILNPGPVISPWISLAVLAVAAAFEGTSLRVAYRQYRRGDEDDPLGYGLSSRHRKTLLYFRFCSKTLQPHRHRLGIRRCDRLWIFPYQVGGRRSVGRRRHIARGCRLCACQRTRSLIAGEAVAPIVMERLKASLARIDCITELKMSRPCIWGRALIGSAHPFLRSRFHDRHVGRCHSRDHAGSSKGG